MNAWAESEFVKISAKGILGDCRSVDRKGVSAIAKR